MRKPRDAPDGRWDGTRLRRAAAGPARMPVRRWARPGGMHREHDNAECSRKHRSKCEVENHEVGSKRITFDPGSASTTDH